jgi:hypothetical protein
MGSCGYCHEIGDRGAPVSLALQDLRAARLDLKSVQSPGVITAQPSGEPAFPAVVAEKSNVRIRVYDISATLPVLRSFLPGEVKLSDGSGWKHTAATARYSADELTLIQRYLEWLADGKF